MSVTSQRHIQIVLDCLRGTPDGEPPRQQAPPEGRHDLDITQGWGMEVGLGRLQDSRDLGRAAGSEEVFDYGRGVDDDNLQGASLVERSSLISSAAGLPRSTRVRRPIRSKSSWGRGRATSRSRSRSTYSVRVSPLARARLTSSRWSLSGTFRTWIILDMRLASHMRGTCAIGRPRGRPGSAGGCDEARTSPVGCGPCPGMSHH